MSWLNKMVDKTKQTVNQGIEDAKTSLNENLENAKLEKEEQARLRKLFKSTNRSKYIELDTNNKLWRLAGDRTVYNFEDLVSYELIQDGNSVTSGGLGIGRAIGGSLIAGPLGAVLGGLTKKRTSTNIVSNLQIRITNKASKNTTSFITFIDKKTKDDSKDYRKAAQLAQETLGILDIITSEIE